MVIWCGVPVFAVSCFEPCCSFRVVLCPRVFVFILFFTCFFDMYIYIYVFICILIRF